MRPSMLLGPLSAAFGVMANPIPRGCIELPAAYGEHVWGMFKGAHKYIKRVPIGTTATGKTRYRYYYNVGHGGGIDSHEHMVEGAKFAHGEGHFHIVKQDGDKLHVRNTATGEEHTITKQVLAQKLAEHHAEGLKAYRDRATKALAEAKANKASPKQIARLEERVKRAGGSKSGEPNASAALTPGSIRNVDVGSTLTFKSPQTGDETNVEYRGASGGLAHVIMNGVGATVAIGSLSRQVKPTRPEVQSFIDSAKAEIHGMNPMLHIDRNNEEPGTARKKIAQSIRAMADGDGIRLTNDEREAATQAVIDHLRSEQAKKTAPKETPKPATESKPPTRIDRSYEAQREASAPKTEGKPSSRAPKDPVADKERRARHEDAAAEHSKAQEHHRAEAEKLRGAGDRYQYSARAHQRASDSHGEAARKHLVARDDRYRGVAQDANRWSRAAKGASESAKLQYEQDRDRRW